MFDLQKRLVRGEQGFGLFITFLVSLIILIVLGTALWMTQWGTKDRIAHYHYEKMYQVAAGQMNAIARFYDSPQNEFALRSTGYFDGLYNTSTTYAGISSSVSPIYPEYTVRNPNWMEADGTFRGDLVITKTTPPVQSVTFKYRIQRYRGNGGTLNLVNLTNNNTLTFPGITFTDTLSSLVAAEDPLGDFVDPLVPIGQIAGDVDQNPKAAVVSGTRTGVTWVPSDVAVTPSKTAEANPDPKTWPDLTGEDETPPANIENADAPATIAAATINDALTYAGQPIMKNFEAMPAPEQEEQNRLSNYSDQHLKNLLNLLLEKAAVCPIEQPNLLFINTDWGTMDFHTPFLAGAGPATFVFLPGGRIRIRMLPDAFGNSTYMAGAINIIAFGSNAQPVNITFETPGFANFGTITLMGNASFTLTKTASTGPAYMVKNYGAVTAVASQIPGFDGTPTINAAGKFTTPVAVGDFPKDLYTNYKHIIPCSSGGTYSAAIRRRGANNPLQAQLSIFSVVQR